MPTPMAWDVVLQTGRHQAAAAASKGRCRTAAQARPWPPTAPGSSLTVARRSGRKKSSRKCLYCSRSMAGYFPTALVFPMFSKAAPPHRTLPRELYEIKAAGPEVNSCAVVGKQVAPHHRGHRPSQQDQCQAARLPQQGRAWVRRARLPVCLVHGFLLQPVLQCGLVDQEGGVLP